MSSANRPTRAAVALALTAIVMALLLIALPTTGSPFDHAIALAAEQPPQAFAQGGAGLTTSCFDDPAGDVGSEQDDRADILEFCIGRSTSALTGSLLVADPVDPLLEPVWRDGLATWIILLHLDDDQTSDVTLGFSGTDEELKAIVASPSTSCEGPGAFDGARLSFELDLTACGFSGDDLTGFNVLLAYADGQPRVDASDNSTIQPGESPEALPIGGRAVGRLAGESRFATAVAISQYQFPDGADEVYLARADSPADALAAGALTKGPLLLVPRCGSVPQVVLDEIRRLDPDRVIALGGRAAVCPQIIFEAANA